MRETPLQTIVQASEIFQEFLKLAAIDGFINFWCFELTLHNGIQIPIEDIKADSRHHILGLHSLNYFIQKKLQEDNHETGLNECSCGWEPSCVPKFEHTAIDRYTVGTVIRWSEGECHVLLAPQDDQDQPVPPEASSDAEESRKSNDEDQQPDHEFKEEVIERPEEAINTTEENDEPSFFQRLSKVSIPEPNQDPTMDSLSDIDEDNSRMLVINEDVSTEDNSRLLVINEDPSTEEKDKDSSCSTQSPSADIQTSLNTAHKNSCPEPSKEASLPQSDNEEEDSDHAVDEESSDDDTSSMSSSSSSSSSYSSTTSDDDDRISFKQRVEQAAKAAREAEAAANSGPVHQLKDQVSESVPERILSTTHNPEDIQAAQGLAALGKSPEFMNETTLKHPQSSKPTKSTTKISQKLIDNQAFSVIRLSGNKFQCSVCGKQYDRYMKVLEHQTTHTGQKPWQCDDCDKKFTNYSSLLIHQRAKHTPLHLQQFNCCVCQKSFGSQSVLQTHMNTHAPRKPHECTICGRTFALKSTRDTHQAQHTGNRPWQCSVCGKSYVTKYKLNLHMKAHTGELFCSICNREFNSQDVLTRHKKKHKAGLIPAKNTSIPSEKTNPKRRATRETKKHQFNNFIAEFKCQVCNKIFSKSTDLSHHLSYCTSISFCPSEQSISNQTVGPTHSEMMHNTGSMIPQSLNPPIDTCLVEGKKIDHFTCPQPPGQQETLIDNRSYMMNEIPAEELTPTLNYQQVIHPNDPIMQSLHGQESSNGVTSLPDFLKQVTFGGASTSDQHIFSNP